MQPLEAAVFATIKSSLNLYPERAFPYPLPVVHVLSVRQETMNTKQIILMSAISGSISLSGCRGFAVALHNVHPSSADNSLLVQPSVLAVDIPTRLSGIESKDLSVEVAKNGRNLAHAAISKEAITKNNSRWNVDISPTKWSTGAYDLRFFADDKLVHQLDVNFSYDLITPLDY